MLKCDRDAVEALWKRIAADPRHHTKVVLERGTEQARTFPDWSMGFEQVEDGDLADFPGYADLGSNEFWERLAQRAPDGAKLVLESFARR